MLKELECFCHRRAVCVIAGVILVGWNTSVANAADNTPLSDLNTPPLGDGGTNNDYLFAFHVPVALDKINGNVDKAMLQCFVEGPKGTNAHSSESASVPIQKMALIAV